MGFMGSLIPILAHCAGLNFIERMNFRQKRPMELAFNLFLKHWELSGLMTFWSHVPYSEVFFVCLVGWITISRWLACLRCLQCLWEFLLFQCHSSETHSVFTAIRFQKYCGLSQSRGVWIAPFCVEVGDWGVNRIWCFLMLVWGWGIPTQCWKGSVWILLRFRQCWP